MTIESLFVRSVFVMFVAKFIFIMFSLYHCMISQECFSFFIIFRLTLMSLPNKVGLKCPYIRPYVHKVSSISLKFGMYVEVDE